MTYEKLLDDIELLIGMHLSSIRPGSEITIIQLDRAVQRLIVRTTDEKEITRPLSEMRKIWGHLLVEQAVHVDTVLAGAGPRRNQPETILANLPYIEWLTIERKKHISFVGERTHPYGTLLEMDPTKALGISQDFKNMTLSRNKVIGFIVTRNISETASLLEDLIGLPLLALEQGLYQQTASDSTIYLIAANKMPNYVKPGTYTVIQTKSPPPSSKLFLIQGREFYALSDGDLNLVAAKV